jgi:type VI protein secretion system component Hcp
MKFREVLLVAVLILAGLVVYQVQTGHWNLDFNWGDDFAGFGREYTAEETRTIEAPLPSAIEIVNGHGWVEVRGGDQDTVQLTFKKVVWRRTEEEAKDIAGRLKYTLTTAADKLTLATNRDEFRKKNFETGFILTVPRAMAVHVANAYGVVRVEGVKEATVHNRHGELYASDIQGPCTLETSYEDLEAQKIQGECRIANSHGDVRAVSVAGDLWIETSYAQVRVEDAGQKADIRGSNVAVDARRVAGAVTIDTSYEKVLLSDVGPAAVTGHNMAVTAENVRGDLDVRTSYEAVRATGVQGRFLVDAHNASVSATGIGGSEISVKTSYENVELADFSAEVTVVLRNGNVTLKPLDLKRGMDVRNEYGTIHLAWPAGESPRLEARSKGGEVEWGLPEKPDIEQSNGVSLIKAFTGNAGAPLVYLSTTYENIRIEAASRKF